MSAVISPSSPAIDLAAAKTRQQAAWAAGNGTLVLPSEYLEVVIERR